MHRIAVFTTCAVSIGMAGGCTSLPTVQQERMTAERNINEHTSRDGDATRQAVRVLGTEEQQAQIDKIINGERERTRKMVDELNAEIARVEEERKSLATHVTSLIGGIAGGPVPGGIFGDFVESLESDLGGASRDLSELARKTVEFENYLDETNRATKQANEKADTVATRIDSVSEALEQKVAVLDEGLRSRLESVRGTVNTEIANILRTTTNPEEVRAQIEQLLISKKLSPSDIEQLKSLSTEELIRFLLTGGLAAGAGGSLSRMGKSRSEPKVVALEKENGEARAKLDKLEEKLRFVEMERAVGVTGGTLPSIQTPR